MKTVSKTYQPSSARSPTGRLLPAHLPPLYASGQGERKPKVDEQAWSYDAGKTWTEMTDTQLPNNNSGIDAVTLRDGRHLLIYNHSTRDEENLGHKGRGVINLAMSRDGVNWEAALVLDYIVQPEKQYSYPSIIQTSDGLVHIVYTWHRERIKHVVVDPDKLVTYPIVDGVWPADKVPLVESPVDAL